MTDLMRTRSDDASPREWMVEVSGGAERLMKTLRALVRDRFDVEEAHETALVLRDRERLVCSWIRVEVARHGEGTRVLVRDVGVPLAGRELAALALVGICLLAGVRMIAAGILHGCWIAPLGLVGCVMLVSDRVAAARRRGQEFAAVTQVVGAAIRAVERGAMDDAYRASPAGDPW